jgi:hypothetical protein
MLRRRIRSREAGIATDPVEKLLRAQGLGCAIRSSARRCATAVAFDDAHLAQPLACSDMTQHYRGPVDLPQDFDLAAANPEHVVARIPLAEKDFTLFEPALRHHGRGSTADGRSGYIIVAAGYTRVPLPTPEEQRSALIDQAKQHEIAGGWARSLICTVPHMF